MTKRQAQEILLPYNACEIREVYDKKDVQEAILTIKPDFEYPDWDQRLVAEIIAQLKRRGQWTLDANGQTQEITLTARTAFEL